MSEGKLYKNLDVFLDEWIETGKDEMAYKTDTETVTASKLGKALLDEAKADFPFTLWQSNPEHITYFPKVKKGQNSDSVFSLGTSFLENAEALQKIAEWFVKWFGASP